MSIFSDKKIKIKKLHQAKIPLAKNKKTHYKKGGYEQNHQATVI